MPSATSGVFAKEMVHDLRAVMTQARTGIDFSERVTVFVHEVARLQDEFANKLAKIVDKEMVNFAVYNDVDGMQNIRDVWMQTIEESRNWATSAKVMSSSLLRLVGPMQRHYQVSAKKLDLIVKENDRLSRPLANQQTLIVKKQLRCNEVVMPMLRPKFKSMPARKQEQIVGRARAEVVKYMEEVDRANVWLSEVTGNARPRMLEVLQRMEEERIERTRRILMRYAMHLHESSSAMKNIAVNVRGRLARYHMEDDIGAFVERITSRHITDREYLAPFACRLPVSLYELGIKEMRQSPTSNTGKGPFDAHATWPSTTSSR
ncbi:hypothetical protein PBRA_003686 [Plasmodiophora brassicae]|uniref:Uncharacterized protein n=1 Tax=Plasmodiophora brassicae TaxID=37360 RepID=A0A0G4II34_PLABS|nr:hypothetical protein PBRA_003686 [Plasmodiophora brassicae]